MYYLLGENLVPNWVANSFPIIKFILLLLIFIASLALIVIVLMQESEGGESTNAITGIKDTYYSKNKGVSRDVRLKRMTTILSIFIAVIVIIYFALSAIYSGSIWSA